MTYIPESIRQAVAKRAKRRCEYCRLHENYAYFTHEIDHIYAEKHGRETTEDNLCLACADCNRYKSSDLCSLDPITNEVVALFHPREDARNEHFRLLESGIIESLTARARATERILRFNRADLVGDREELLSLGGYDE